MTKTRRAPASRKSARTPRARLGAVDITSQHDSRAGWQTESVRLSIFHSNIGELGLLDLEQFAEGQILQKGYNAEVQQQICVMGLPSRPNSAVVTALQRDRADLIIRDRPQQHNKPYAPNLGNLRPNIELCLELFSKWLVKGQNLQRVALGAVVVRPVANEDEVAREIFSIITGLSYSPGIRDLEYKINRPRQSDALPGMIINRLMQFESIRYEWLARQAGVHVLGQVPPIFAAQCSLDINTSKEHEVPAKSLGAILAELANLSLELAGKGDIP